MSYLLADGKFRAESDLGFPGVGFLLYSYAAGPTTTLKDTYTDSTLTVANTNPIVCNSRGEANVFLGNGAYYLVLTTPQGVTVWTQDGLTSPTYEVAQSQAASATLLNGFKTDLANNTTTGLGGNLVGTSLVTAPLPGTVNSFFLDGPVQLSWFLSTAERAQVLAYGYTLDLTPKLVLALSIIGDRPLHLMAGGWSFTSIDFRGYYGGLIGEGMYVEAGGTKSGTLIKCRASTAIFINAAETSDVIVSPFTLSDLTVDGNSLAVLGMSIRYRHHYRMANVMFANCTNKGIYEIDTFLARTENVRVTATVYGWHLAGSNHGSIHSGATITACSNIHLLIESNGTANDGNDALGFPNICVSDGSGTGIDYNGTSATFTSPYIGENINGAVLITRGGVLKIDGGVLFFGATATSFLFAPAGGRAIVSGARINGQTYGSLGYLNSTNFGGKWSLRDCLSALAVGGDQVLPGDVLDYGPSQQTFTKRLGRLATSSVSGATATQLISANAITYTCNTLTTGTPTIAIDFPLTATHPDWQDGGNAYLVVVYLSNADHAVRFTGGALGASPNSGSIATLPNTAGVIKTYIKVDAVLGSAAYTTLEFYRDNCAPGDYLKVMECFLSDARMLNKGSGVLGNLYKC